MLGGLKLPALALAILALPVTASATGGVWCDAEDANLNFHFKAVSSRDGTGNWFGFEGVLETKAKTPKMPASVMKFDVSDDATTERWWDGKDVRLIVQKSASEADNFARVHLEVMTTAVEEATYQGTYELRLSPPEGESVLLTGKVACSAD